MRMQSLTMSVPEGMIPYFLHEDEDQGFARNAMMLYPLIQNLTISHGRAAEILGVRKTDLIQYYESLGIPYLDQSNEDLAKDLATLDQVLGVLQ